MLGTTRRVLTVGHSNCSQWVAVSPGGSPVWEQEGEQAASPGDSRGHHVEGLYTHGNSDTSISGQVGARLRKSMDLLRWHSCEEQILALRQVCVPLRRILTTHNPSSTALSQTPCCQVSVVRHLLSSHC